MQNGIAIGCGICQVRMTFFMQCHRLIARPTLENETLTILIYQLLMNGTTSTKLQQSQQIHFVRSISFLRIRRNLCACFPRVCVPRKLIFPHPCHQICALPTDSFLPLAFSINCNYHAPRHTTRT